MKQVVKVCVVSFCMILFIGWAACKSQPEKQADNDQKAPSSNITDAKPGSKPLDAPQPPTQEPVSPQSTGANLTADQFVGNWHVDVELDADTIWQVSADGQIVAAGQFDAVTGIGWSLDGNQLTLTMEYPFEDWKATQTGTVTRVNDTAFVYDLGHTKHEFTRATTESEEPQMDDLSDGITKWVSANDGLIMYASPSMDSEQLTTLELGTQVIEVPLTDPVPMFIEDMDGYWANIYYGPHAGYVFSGFLTTTNPAEWSNE